MARASGARHKVNQLRRIARWRPQRPATVSVALLVVGGLAVLAGWIYVLPRVLVPDRSAASLAAVTDPAKRLELEDARLKQRNDVRATLLQGLAGAVVAVGLSLTWRQIRVNQEGQITERFNKAIDHLGSDKLDLRLGGIYALERIAKNSNDDRDTIAEILAAFVRQRSPWPPSQPGQYRDDFPIRQQPPLRTRAPDIQAALTVLGRGGFTRQGTLQLDLAAVDLRRAALDGAHLEGASLREAHSKAQGSSALTSTARSSTAFTSTARALATLTSTARGSMAPISTARCSTAPTWKARTCGTSTWRARPSSVSTSKAPSSSAPTSKARTSAATSTAQLRTCGRYGQMASIHYQTASSSSSKNDTR
jgi:hypothetical protein